MKAFYCLALLTICGLLAGCDTGSSVPAGQGVGISPLPDLYLDPPGGYLSNIPPPPPPEFFNPPPVYAEPAMAAPAPVYEAIPAAPGFSSPY